MIHRIGSFFRRNNGTIAVSIGLLFFMAIFYVQSLAISKIQEQIDGQKKLVQQVKGIANALDKKAVDSKEQVDTINKHIDCISLFFAQPDRTKKTIDNIESCTLKNIVSTNVQGQGSTSNKSQSASSSPSSQPKSSPSRSLQPASGGTPIAAAQPPAEQPSPPASEAPSDQGSDGFISGLIQGLSDSIKVLLKGL